MPIINRTGRLLTEKNINNNSIVLINPFNPTINSKIPNVRFLSGVPAFLRPFSLLMATQTGYGTRPVGCRDGSRYVQGCWGFLPWKSRGFCFLFLCFESYKMSMSCLICRCFFPKTVNIVGIQNFGIYKHIINKCSRRFSWFFLGILVSPKIKIYGFGKKGPVQKYRNHRNEEFRALP